jgi:hypothetical protein
MQRCAKSLHILLSDIIDSDEDITPTSLSSNTMLCKSCEISYVYSGKNLGFCGTCFSIASAEIRRCLDNGHEFKRHLPDTGENHRIVLARPLIESRLLELFLEEVSWSVKYIPSSK